MSDVAMIFITSNNIFQLICNGFDRFFWRILNTDYSLLYLHFFAIVLDKRIISRILQEYTLYNESIATGISNSCFDHA